VFKKLLQQYLFISKPTGWFWWPQLWLAGCVTRSFLKSATVVVLWWCWRCLSLRLATRWLVILECSYFGFYKPWKAVTRMGLFVGVVDELTHTYKFRRVHLFCNATCRNSYKPWAVHVFHNATKRKLHRSQSVHLFHNATKRKLHRSQAAHLFHNATKRNSEELPTAHQFGNGIVRNPRSVSEKCAGTTLPWETYYWCPSSCFALCLTDCLLIDIKGRCSSYKIFSVKIAS